jgi:CheY-like chemotaxis protein
MLERQSEFIDCLPHLRRYAFCLTGSRELGDDLIEYWVKDLIAWGEDSIFRQPMVEILSHFHRRAPTPADLEDVGEGLPKPTDVHSRLLALPLAQRQAMILHLTMGMEVSEVAKILGWPERHVLRVIRRTQKQLQDRKPTALVIEDEALIGLEISQVLEDMGFNVAALAADEAEALAAAERHQPDLIVADVRLAHGDNGVEAVRSICRRQYPSIVYVTAFPDRASGLDRDISGPVLTKPFMASALVKSVHIV